MYLSFNEKEKVKEEYVQNVEEYEDQVMEDAQEFE